MTNLQTVKSTLTSAAARLNNDEAALEAQLLLQHVLNLNRAWLIAHENDVLDVKDGQANHYVVFEALLKRRLSGEPIAYILGYREFYGLKLKVTPDTLIPRPDTETLVEAALARIPAQNVQTPSFPRKRESMLNLNQKMDSRFRGNDELSNISKITQPLHILDLGTGTGAIALAIAKNRPNAFVTAVDASENALKIAQENAQNLAITNVKFVQSNWFSALKSEKFDAKFDLIVSNPPYIEANDIHLTKGDLRYEPITALASGQDGLDDICKIIDSAPKHLNPRGWLMLEHGYNQADSVAHLLSQGGFTEVGHALDLAGIQRVTLGRLI